MARSDLARLARTQPPHLASKKSRARARKRNGSGPPARSEGSAFSDLEQAFFDAAPPDEPAPPAEPERFDDVLAVPPRGRDAWFECLRWAVATARAALTRLVEGSPAQRSARR